MVMAIFMVILGVVFLSGLPTEQYPDITPPIVEVRANYTGATTVQPPVCNCATLRLIP